MRSSRALLVLLACICLGIAACDTEQGHPVPAAAGKSAPASSSAPQSDIADPLNTTTLQAGICAALTPAQLAPYLGTIRKQEVLPTRSGVLCGYDPVDDEQPNLSIGVLTDGGGSQQYLYDESQLYPYRKKIAPIDGYPAINNAQGTNGPTTGDCQTFVAVAAKRTIIAQYDGSTAQSTQYYTSACTVTNALAADVIAFLKAGR